VKPRVVLKGRLLLATTTTATDRITGMDNGSPAISTLRKTDWADSDDDEDFIASFSAKKNPRVIALEHEVVEKDTNIETLNVVIATKDVRIAELEETVGEKELHIATLEADVEEKDTQLEKLKSDNHTQFLYVQELVGEVDEKSRRVQQLETELDGKCARIRELEESESESSPETQVSADELVKVDLPEAAAQAGLDTSTAKAIADEAIPEPLQSTIPDSPKKRPTGPAANESKLPKLWSPDPPKQVAPVEKPKVLKMAIDTSKFVKKAPCAAAKKTEPSKDPPKPTYGQSTRHRTKTSAIPKFQVDKDIRHMSHAIRVIFANGPEIDVMLGTTQLMALPKYIFMQCSSKAYQHFIDHPEMTHISFTAGSMDVEAAKAHLQWMDEMTYQGRVYSLTLNTDEKFDAKNLRICQAARVMGLNNTYVGHFTKVMCNRVRSGSASIKFLSLICELAVPDNDPIFDCLANNLVNQQKDGLYSEQLQELFAQYPLLMEQMTKIEQRVKDSRAADERNGRKSRDGSQNRDSGRGETAAKQKIAIF
jgi:hypothetical protein